MPTLPDYVEHAFNAIRVITTQEWLQEDLTWKKWRASGCAVLAACASDPCCAGRGVGVLAYLGMSLATPRITCIRSRN